MKDHLYTPDAGSLQWNPCDIKNAERSRESTISYDDTLRKAPHSPIHTPRSQTPTNSRPSSPSRQGSKKVLELLFSKSRELGASAIVVSGQALFQGAPSEPWINRTRLRKLEILSIVNALDLRWDINFTMQLAYRRAEGPESELDTEEIQKYWKAIRIELELYTLLSKALKCGALGSELNTDTIRSAVQKRVRRLFITIKDILKTILPQNEQVYLERLFDIDFMMGEILSGCLNFVSVATWLSEILLRHCAPVRDDKIKGFVNMISKGDFDSLTQGLSEILSTLELMKIDTSNHVLKHFKPHFINLTITFGVRYFGKRIQGGKFHAKPVRTWFLKNRHPRTPDITQARTRNIELCYFVEAFIRHLSPCCETSLPETFDMDAYRIEALRKTMAEVVQLRICRLILKHNLRQLNVVLPSDAETDLFLRIGLASKIAGGMTEAAAEIASIMVRTIMRHSKRTICVSDVDLIDDIRCRLQADLASTSYKFYSEEMEVINLLSVNAFNTADSLLNSNPWDIFNKLVPSTSKPASFSASGLSPDAWRNENQVLRDMSDLIAHILLLNWRVFGEMIYLNDGLDEHTADSGIQQDSTPKRKQIERRITVRPRVPR
jgi:T-complex protein 11